MGNVGDSIIDVPLSDSGRLPQEELLLLLQGEVAAQLAVRGLMQQPPGAETLSQPSSAATADTQPCNPVPLVLTATGNWQHFDKIVAVMMELHYLPGSSCSSGVYHGAGCEGDEGYEPSAVPPTLSNSCQSLEPSSASSSSGANSCCQLQQGWI